MAKTSSINRNLKRQKMAKNQYATRKDLREKAIDLELSEEDRAQARHKLQSLPRNGATCRVKSRCSVTGRARAVYRRFGLSRLKFREFALEGKIPGVIKASW